MTFTVHPSPFIVRYPCLPDRQAFTVYRLPWLMDNGKCMVNGKWLTVNGFTRGEA